MSSPPTTGPSAIGMRRTSEWSETPIVRLFLGSTDETMLIVAGSESAVQEMNRIAPRITACQVGTRMTSA